MTADTLEMFQDLNLRTRSADVSIRDAILKHVKAPWLHDPKREEETSSLRFRGEDVIALIREPSNGIEESALMLWQEDDGFRVSARRPRAVARRAADLHHLAPGPEGPTPPHRGQTGARPA